MPIGAFILASLTILTRQPDVALERTSNELITAYRLKSAAFKSYLHHYLNQMKFFSFLNKIIMIAALTS
jgi:hypothetical protein